MITELQPNEIFVFGSNREGVHGAGAAWQALKWGAVRGVGEGHQEQTYALPTRHYLHGRLQTLSLPDVRTHVETFIEYAKAHPGLRFLLTAVGCGLAGLTVEDIAPMFRDAPTNVVLPPEFLLYFFPFKEGLRDPPAAP